MCSSKRGGLGMLRGAWAKWRGVTGFLADNDLRLRVQALAQPPASSLLLHQLNDAPLHHEDTFSLRMAGTDLIGKGAKRLLSELLQGFMLNPPLNVSRMMALRNVLVKPMGLRTSPLGCPVSSLLSAQVDNLFDQRYPVLDQHIDAHDRYAQVILGADDKHLRFRSCVGVQIGDDQHVHFTLGSRVQCRNLFGRIYMALIHHTHRAYITPTMLRMAVEHVTTQ